MYPTATKFGFVLHSSALRRLGVPARHLPPSSEIGFVLRILPLGPDPGTAKLGSFRTFQSPAEPRPTGQLRLPTHPSLPKFGFVLRIWPPASDRGRSKLGSFCAFRLQRPSGRAKLGSFCTFLSRAEPHPTRLSLPTHPNLPKFGFVLLIWPPASDRGRSKLGSFCAFRLQRPSGRAKLGSFCAFGLRRPTAAGPNWVRFAHFASGVRPGGRNWVRFARFTPRPSHGPHDCLCPHTPISLSLGSFCAFGLRRWSPCRPNWVRFAQSLSGEASRPASPRPFPGARARLGSFCAFRLRRPPTGRWARGLKCEV
jgi:hypothetical protein